MTNATLRDGDTIVGTLTGVGQAFQTGEKVLIVGIGGKRSYVVTSVTSNLIDMQLLRGPISKGRKPAAQPWYRQFEKRGRR